MVSAKKQTLVQQLVADVKEYPIVGVVDLHTLPAQQLQVMRRMLAKSKVEIVMARKRLLKRALEASQLKNVQELSDKIKGMPALILARDNPFTLYSIIQKNKSEAPAKPGQISPRDI